MLESGDERARPVLLVHGWGVSAYMWRDWFHPLAKAGFRAIAPDLPGHGLSDKPEDGDSYTLDGLVSGLRSLIETERLASAHVVAQSMGGTIGLALAARAEVSLGRLVLVNPACFGVVHNLSLAQLVSTRAMESMLERVVPRWVVARARRVVYGDPSRMTEENIDQYWAPSQFPGYARAMGRLLHGFSWQRIESGRMAATLRALRGEATPPLVILGTRDRLVRDARPYVASLRAAGAPLEVYESHGGGHAVNEERPEEIVPVVLRFLQAPREPRTQGVSPSR